MKRTTLLAVSLSTMLIAGGAIAQEGTTRGGAQSGMPSTKQNSPATSQTTGVNKATGGAQTSGQGQMDKNKIDKMDKMDDAKKTAPAR